MPEDDAYLIKKITSHESDLLAIYEVVYSVLKKVEPATLPCGLEQELGRFDPPSLIEPAKAAAILKAMLGSTSEDKFSLENCYLVKTPGGEQSVSGLVEQRLNDLGIKYHHFWPYLRAHGWLE